MRAVVMCLVECGDIILVCWVFFPLLFSLLFRFRYYRPFLFIVILVCLFILSLFIAALVGMHFNFSQPKCDIKASVGEVFRCLHIHIKLAFFHFFFFFITIDILYVDV